MQMNVNIFAMSSTCDHKKACQVRTNKLTTEYAF